MSTVEEHVAEQAAITAAWEATHHDFRVSQTIYYTVEVYGIDRASARERLVRMIEADEDLDETEVDSSTFVIEED